MLSQHCQEIYITLADVREEYIRWLDGTTPEDGSDKFADQFLVLQLYGPFKIFKPADMKVFGRIAVALTLQQHLDLDLLQSIQAWRTDPDVMLT